MKDLLVSVASHSLHRTGRVKVVFPHVKPRESGFDGTTGRAEAIPWVLTEDNGILIKLKIKLEVVSDSAVMKDKERILQRKIAMEFLGAKDE